MYEPYYKHIDNFLARARSLSFQKYECIVENPEFPLNDEDKAKVKEQAESDRDVYFYWYGLNNLEQTITALMNGRDGNMFMGGITKEQIDPIIDLYETAIKAGEEKIGDLYERIEGVALGRLPPPPKPAKPERSKDSIPF
jgi:hypothetical protein